MPLHLTRPGLSPQSTRTARPRCDRYLEKDLAASSQAARRLQSAELEAASNRLALLRQQIEIERSIGAAATEHLGRAAAARQDDAVGWGSRREEDVHAKERQIEVGRVEAKWHRWGGGSLADSPFAEPA